jgi:hypothetical protein
MLRICENEYFDPVLSYMFDVCLGKVSRVGIPKQTEGRESCQIRIAFLVNVYRPRMKCRQWSVHVPAELRLRRYDGYQ